MKSISIDHFRTRFSFDLEGDEFRPDGNVTVFRATDNELHREVALKIIQDDAVVRRYPSLKEMAKLFKLEHGHLVRYFDFLRVEKSKTDPGFDVLVMDFITGGNLGSLRGTFITEEKRSRVVEGIMSGIGVLHQNDVFHGNLKPGNVLFQDIGHLHVRLGDYGFVFAQEYEKTGTQYGIENIQYLAPEQIEPENFARRGRIRQNVDFWALGMLVYELFTGKYAFGESSGTTSDLMTKILHADLPQDLDHLPENYAELVRACLVRNAPDRPQSVDVLRRILDGEVIWENGRTRKKPKPKPQAKEKKEKPSAPPPPAEVKCGNCGQMNNPRATSCGDCGMALKGPVHLKAYRRTGPPGFWAMLFMTALFVPLGFLYYNFYQQCNWDSDACNFLDWLHKQRVVSELETAAMNTTDAQNFAKEVQALAIASLGILAIGILMAGTFFMVWFFRVSANLYALGSMGQRYHRIFMLISFVALLIGGGLVVVNPIVGVILMIGSLVTPLLMFQEVWKGSNPSYLGSDAKWRQSKSSFMIFSWWITSILLPVIVVIPFWVTPFEWLTYKGIFFLGIGLVATYWLLSMLLVIRINRRQAAKFNALARQG
jgi:hypothetical protein